MYQKFNDFLNNLKIEPTDFYKMLLANLMILASLNTIFHHDLTYNIAVQIFTINKKLVFGICFP